MGQLLEAWNAFYSNHAALRTAVEFLHIAGLMLAGGSAISADLAMLRADRHGAAMHGPQLETLRITHRLVLLGLAALTVSGVLLFAADVGTFLWSKIFWLKMGLLALLLTNGALMQRSERQVLRDAPGAWPRLRRTAIVSLVLWFVTTLAGAALPNIG